MSLPPESERVVTVLLSVPPPRSTTNPYVVLLADALRATPGLDVRAFSWAFAVTGRYDVFHIHWPENLLRGNGLVRTVARHVMAEVLLTRLRVKRTPVVRTLHNIEPHEPASRWSRRLLRSVDRLTVATISLNDTTPHLPGVTDQVIRHGDYRPWYSHLARRPALPGRLISFGAVRAYKNLPALLAAFAEVSGPELRLTIAGSCSDPGLADDLRARASSDARVELLLAHQTDQELVTAITSSELVVLPYREMHNSGALIAALSLGRPVLVPSNPVTDSLVDEVGSFWVRRYSVDLTPEDLLGAMLGPPAEDQMPDLHLRQWDSVGPRHRSVYRSALARTARSRASMDDSEISRRAQEPRSG